MSKVDIPSARAALNTQERMVISSIHHILEDIKNNPERYEYPVQLIEDFEFALQGLWKFPRDANYHSHFLDIKGCTCGRLDTLDRLGFGRVVNMGCIWHGKGGEV